MKALETQSSNKRVYFVLRGEIKCLNKLIDKYSEDGSVSITCLRRHLKATESKFNEFAERSRQLGNIKPQQFKEKI